MDWYSITYDIEKRIEENIVDESEMYYHIRHELT